MRKIKRGMEIISQGKKYIVAKVLSLDHGGISKLIVKPRPSISAHPISRFGKPRMRSTIYLGRDWKRA